MLLKAGADVDHPYVLLEAVEMSREEVVIMLLEAGVNPNRGISTSDRSPLGEACYRGLVGTVEALVAHGVHVTSDEKVNAP